MFKRNSDPPYFIRKIQVKKSRISKAGMGVFATGNIKKHEIFERSPVITFHKQIIKDFQGLHGSKHVLSDYLFDWKDGLNAIALGHGSMYNHANNGDGRNASFRLKYDKVYPAIEFFAIQDIAPEDEILIHYACGDADLVFGNNGSVCVDENIKKTKKGIN